MGLEIFTLRERPDLRPAIFLPDLQSVWPEFMRHDATAQLYFAPSQFEAYLDYAFAGVADGKVVARAFSVPFAFNVEGRDELPDGGLGPSDPLGARGSDGRACVNRPKRIGNYSRSRSQRKRQLNCAVECHEVLRAS